MLNLLILPTDDPHEFARALFGSNNQQLVLYMQCIIFATQRHSVPAIEGIGVSPNLQPRGFSLLMNSRADLGAHRVLIESAPRDQ